MMRFVTGNIFESGADCIINTVNCEGFMGKGIAYQFKMRFPENNLDYIKACKTGRLQIGTIHNFNENGIEIVNFPTKDKWREKSKITYIDKGLEKLIELIELKKPNIIAIPPLGCGNGGLDWNEVKELIVKKLEPIEKNYTFLIYEPSITYKAIPKQAPIVNVSGLILMDIRMNLAKFNSIRLQKAGFFVNLFLEEEYFKFDKWKFGPYSHAIDIVARSVSEYQKHYGLSNTKDTYDQVYKVLCSKKTETKIDKIHPSVIKATEYLNEIKTDKKLEGVATVLYIVKMTDDLSTEQIVEKFKMWSEDKAERFNKENIEEYIEYLENTNIIAKNICGNYELASKMWS